MKKFFICLIIMALSFTGCSKIKKDTLGTNSKFSTYTIPTSQSIFLDGTIQHLQQQTFLQDDTKGTIDKINVSDKQEVKKGQVLFTYKNDTVIQQYNSLDSQLKNLQNQYNSTNSASASTAAIDTGSGTPASVNTKSEIDKSLQSQDDIKKQMDAIKDTRYTSITAPFDGIVTLASNASSSKDTIKQVLTLTDPKMQVVANVSEKDVLKLKVGQSVKITVYGTSEDVNGTIRSISSEAAQGGDGAAMASAGAAAVTTSNVSYYPVYIDIDKQSGFFASFHVQGKTTAQNELPKIPKEAVISRNGESFVWKIVKGKTKKAKVDIKALNSSYYEVNSGLNFGDKLLRKGSNNVKEGASIGSSSGN